MIIYNTTFVMSPELEAAFLAFVRQEYIPCLLRGEVLHTPRLSRIISAEEGVDSVSIALSFDAPSEEILMGYMLSEGQEAPRKLIERFGESVVGFTTLMEQLAVDL